VIIWGAADYLNICYGWRGKSVNVALQAGNARSSGF
jgi:hypothetical protein